MKIRFETTIDDVIAFNHFHYSNSPAWRKRVWVQSLLVSVVVAGVLAMVVVINANRVPDPLVLLVMSVCLGTTWLAGSIGWVFLIRWFLYRTLTRNVHKFLAEGSNRTMYGWREMEIGEGRLLLHTELLDVSMDLRAIEKIVSNDEYTFVYFGSTTAYMIPMHVYPEEEHGEFVAELREAWENREVPMPADDEPPNRRQINEGFVERDW